MSARPWSLVLACLVVGSLGLALLVTSCSDKDAGSLTDEGYTRLGKSEWSRALESFEAALEDLKPEDELYVRAKLGQAEALVKIDAARARDEFLELARTQPARVEATDFSLIAGKLASARQFLPAIDVMDAGLKAHVEHPKMLAVKESIIEQSKKAADPAALSKLKSMGYL